MEGVRLIIPSPEYLESYYDACVESKAHDIQIYSMNDPEKYDSWKDTIFDDYDKERKGVGLPEGFVPASMFWLVDDDKFIGAGNIRHRLTPKLERFGGHIGYAIRPSCWNKGYGSLQLKLLIEEARKLGINPALLTCNLENKASAKVMENNGGKLVDIIENIIEGKQVKTCRYHI